MSSVCEIGPCHSFSVRGKVGSPSHEKEVCVVQQKENVSNLSATFFFPVDGILCRACARQGLAILFQREERWALLHIKRRFVGVQQKESRDICKILFKEVKILPNKQIALSGL